MSVTIVPPNASILVENTHVDHFVHITREDLTSNTSSNFNDNIQRVKSFTSLVDEVSNFQYILTRYNKLSLRFI